MSAHLRLDPPDVRLPFLHVALPLALGLAAAPLAAQDVELLAERYGTRLPQGYYETLRTFPDAYRFENGRAARVRQRMLELSGDRASLRSVDPALVLGPRDGPVEGTVRVPVLLGLFKNTPADVVRFTVDEVQEAFFSENPASITAYYREVSLNRLELGGDVQDWLRSDVSSFEATGGNSGLSSNTVGPFIVDLLDKTVGVDWGLYDNDGPDGIPNSGDDDGIVDALTVVQPTPGAECGGTDQDDRIWSHRWALRYAASDLLRDPVTREARPYESQTPAAGGGFIQIDDYTIQPALDCNGEDLSPIGVFTHELGHAFGLPDLYDTFSGDGKHSGAGTWDLMATGSWGCDNHSPDSPCHMSAWSKAALGWVDVVHVDPDVDLGTITIPAVETSGTVYRVDAQDGSGEYFLLENRQAIGFDQYVHREGLLIWQIDPIIVADRWPRNEVNGFSDMGVWLRQADGQNDLGTSSSGRGDRGDPFPFIDGDIENREFHAKSSPAATSRAGTPTGLTIVGIERGLDDVSLRLLTRATRVTVRTDGDEGKGARFLVDGAPVTSAAHTFLSFPFLKHRIEAPLGSLADADGVRQGFEGWSDDATAPRSRELTTPLEDMSLLATYGGRQVELAVAVTGGVDGIAPARFVSDPGSEDLWFSEGAAVTVEAVPVQGFNFLEWTGALAGQPNPASVVMNGTVSAGADFELIYGVESSTVSISAAVDPNVTFEPDNGTAPYMWTVLDGVLPAGTSLSADGRLSGAAMETGSFPLSLQVRDAIGLTARGDILLEVAQPVIPISQLASSFLGVGPPLEQPQRIYLDQEGNANGSYDLGDLREWVLANPDVPWTAAVRALVTMPRTVTLPVRPGASRQEGGR